MRVCRGDALHNSIKLSGVVVREEREEREDVYVLQMYVSMAGRYVEARRREEIVDKVSEIVAI